jgi:hypothetical protein
LTAYHPDAAPPHDRRIEISVDQNKNVTIGNKKIESTIKLELEPSNNISNAAGVVFLIFILMVLFGVAALYWYLHNLYPSQPKPINAQITRLLELSKEKASIEDPDYELIAETVNDAKKMFETLSQTEILDEHNIKVVEILFNDLTTAVQEEKQKEILSALRLLDESLREEPGYFWQESPLNLLEMLFWAIAATLIRLAMNAGRYLRRRDFYFNAIPHHVGYFFAVPIMAVLIAFVLSFVNVDFRLGESGISIDFGNVIVSIVIASLVGLTPWRASEFLENLADTFFTKIGEIFKQSEEKDASLPRGEQKAVKIILSEKNAGERQPIVSGPTPTPTPAPIPTPTPSP